MDKGKAIARGATAPVWATALLAVVGCYALGCTALGSGVRQDHNEARRRDNAGPRLQLIRRAELKEGPLRSVAVTEDTVFVGTATGVIKTSVDDLSLSESVSTKPIYRRSAKANKRNAAWRVATTHSSDLESTAAGEHPTDAVQVWNGSSLDAASYAPDEEVHDLALGDESLFVAHADLKKRGELGVPFQASVSVLRYRLGVADALTRSSASSVFEVDNAGSQDVVRVALADNVGAVLHQGDNASQLFFLDLTQDPSTTTSAKALDLVDLAGSQAGDPQTHFDEIRLVHVGEAHYAFVGGLIAGEPKLMVVPQAAQPAAIILDTDVEAEGLLYIGDGQPLLVGRSGASIIGIQIPTEPDGPWPIQVLFENEDNGQDQPVTQTATVPDSQQIVMIDEDSVKLLTLVGGDGDRAGEVATEWLFSDLETVAAAGARVVAATAINTLVGTERSISRAADKRLDAIVEGLQSAPSRLVALGERSAWIDESGELHTTTDGAPVDVPRPAAPEHNPKTQAGRFSDAVMVEGHIYAAYERSIVPLYSANAPSSPTLVFSTRHYNSSYPVKLAAAGGRAIASYGVLGGSTPNYVHWPRLAIVTLDGPSVATEQEFGINNESPLLKNVEVHDVALFELSESGYMGVLSWSYRGSDTGRPAHGLATFSTDERGGLQTQVHPQSEPVFQLVAVPGRRGPVLIGRVGDSLQSTRRIVAYAYELPGTEQANWHEAARFDHSRPVLDIALRPESHTVAFVDGTQLSHIKLSGPGL